MTPVERAQFGILGTLEVVVNGQGVAIATPQQRRFVCILLLAHGRSVAPGSVAELMWPDSDGSGDDAPKDPVATVRVYASRLRKTLPETIGPRLVAGGYRIDIGAEDLDAGRFEALLSLGTSLLADNPAEAARCLRQALGLWRGEVLAEFRDERWVLGTAVRLEELKLSALERLHDARLALGEHRDLAGDIERLVEANPLRERLWAQLMLALYRSGRQADALRAFGRLREVLVDELGIEPSRELAELETSILRQEPSLDLLPSPAPLGSPTSRSSAGGPTAAASEPVVGPATVSVPAIAGDLLVGPATGSVPMVTPGVYVGLPTGAVPAVGAFVGPPTGTVQAVVFGPPAPPPAPVAGDAPAGARTLTQAPEGIEEVAGLDVKTNIPSQVTSFVGRQKEMSELRTLTESFRLLTLTGPGGSGKTRLACEVASAMLDDPAVRADRSGGIFLVELAAVTDPEEVPVAVAAAIGLKVPAGTPALAAVIEALRISRTHLIVDNCEHLIDACAAVCDAMVRSCHDVWLLATSREPLGIDGEVIYRVPPLAVPPPDALDADVIAGEDAVRLFLDRARAHQPGLQVDDSNATTVASLCRRLDGIPLALELVAARLRALSLEQIHQRLDMRFRLLVGGGRTRLPRQQTLQSLIDWSYDLLDSRERATLRRLSVFSGSFDLEMATAVLADVAPAGGGGLGLDDWAVLDCVSSLVDKSLVTADAAERGTRFHLLETIRAYAAELFASQDGPDVQEQTRRRHALAYLGFAETAAPEVSSPEQFEWLDRLDLDLDNLRAALAYLVASPDLHSQGLRMVVALSRFCAWRGHESELFVSAEALAARPRSDPSDPLEVRARLVFLKILGQIDPAPARRQLESLLDEARATGDKSLEAEVLNRLSWSAFTLGERAEGEQFHAGAVAAARAAGDYVPLLMALNGGCAPEEHQLEALELATGRHDAIGRFMVLSNLGSDALDRGDLAAAREWLEQALPIVERVSPSGDANFSANLAGLRYLDGDAASAAEQYAEALEAAQRHFDDRHVAYSIGGLAACAEASANHLLAAALFGASDARLSESGFALEEVGQRIRTESV
ncbi:MAG TPA: BTAD domain-containing putative transcriptional regulator, partial [Acidimicrobiales bacterium]|nr:BTAD domain-containing putative transcriptional regulator [Acidimicrobiales bacterium]